MTGEFEYGQSRCPRFCAEPNRATDIVEMAVLSVVSVSVCVWCQSVIELLGFMLGSCLGARLCWVLVCPVSRFCVCVCVWCHSVIELLGLMLGIMLGCKVVLGIGLSSLPFQCPCVWCHSVIEEH